MLGSIPDVAVTVNDRAQGTQSTSKQINHFVQAFRDVREQTFDSQLQAEALKGRLISVPSPKKSPRLHKREGT